MSTTNETKIRWAIATSAVVACVAGAVACSVSGKADQLNDNGNCPATAAAKYGWGAPKRSDDFNDPSELGNWWLYDGPGHTGNGRRTPDAVAVSDGLLTITGDEQGNSGGMALKGPGQITGRWEVCVKSPAVTNSYHSVLLAWPDAEDWPAGGEIDFMEIPDPTRQNVQFNLHHGADDQIESGAIHLDATQWHSWSVEWTPQHMTAYVDGVEWWTNTNPAAFPPRRMHLCMQLDDFGGGTRGGGKQIVDWAREYSYP